MKIAVTYENGNVFQHFGKTESFKIYETDNNKILASEVVGNDGIGHCALAGLLRDKGINVLICGGLGMGAQMALAQSGITVVSGAQGSADEAVNAYLDGSLISMGATCDHHHDHAHNCGHYES